MMGDRDGRFAGTPRHHYPVPKLQEGRQEEINDGRPGRAICWDTRQHYPVTKLQEGRQEEIMMGDKDGRFAGDRGARHHYPVPKLQEKRQEEIMMGDKDWRFPETPGTTTFFSII